MGFRTQSQVDRLRLPEGRAEAYIFDDEQVGLSVRLQGKAKRWVVWYTANGKRRRVTLGAVAGIPLRQARIEAGRIIGNAREGKDALAEREVAKRRSGDILLPLVQMFLERRAKPRQRARSYREAVYYLTKLWAPLHSLQVGSITRRDVASRLEEIRVGNGPIAAIRARVYLNSVFAWGMRQGLVESNPVIGTEKPAEERRRDRVLSPAELATVWKAADGSGEFGVIVKLLMLTGQRREEVAGMRWSEFDPDRALWVLAAERVKNARQHEVPLSRQVLALLPERRENRAHVFGRSRKGGFSGFSQAKTRLDAAAGLETPWTLHDLRRSAVTHMAEIGIDPHVIEAAVNHISGHRAGVAGTYNLASYRPQKAAALQAYADWLEAVVEGREPDSNVVRLHK
jgi:integrase